MSQFSIIEYISGLSTYIFDKAVLTNIAYHRGVIDVTTYEELDDKTKELLYADLLFVIYNSPTQSASVSLSHGNSKEVIGGQTSSNTQKNLDTMRRIYTKYGDSKLDLLPQNGENTMSWLDEGNFA